MTDLPVVKMIWAQSSNRAIGKDNQIPWRLSEDLNYFQRMTHGYPVIMGKNTWISLPESSRPLPGRRNIILSRNPETFDHEGAECYPNLRAAMIALRGEETVWVIGGAGVYAAAMPLASELHVTSVRVKVEDADTFMPPIPEEFTQTAASDIATSANGIVYWFSTYNRL